MKKYSVVSFCKYIDDKNEVIQTNNLQEAVKVANRQNYLLEGVAETRVIINK